MIFYTATILAITITMIVLLLSSILHHFNFHKLDNYICPKCISFWSVLILSQGNIFLAAITAFISYLIDKYLI